MEVRRGKAGGIIQNSEGNPVIGLVPGCFHRKTDDVNRAVGIALDIFPQVKSCGDIGAGHDAEKSGINRDRLARGIAGGKTNYPFVSAENGFPEAALTKSAKV
jgi:hypothetical protein